MDFKKVAEERRSTRKFKSNSIPKEDIKEIIRIGTLAPSAHNTQKWFFKVVYNKEINTRASKTVLAKINSLVERYEVKESVKGWRFYSSFFNNAPVVIYAFHSPAKGFLEDLVGDKMGPHEIAKVSANPGIQSIAGAIQNILLAATSMGYGGCWMTAPNVAAREIEKVLGVVGEWKLAAVIPVGVPLEVPQARPRKPLNEVMEIVE
ncbi:MAG: hypothetical protein APF76_08835 [Desulfitibacter sp. BRH_c19]|nr:MAG: hypothetical protein APF76_08835 [Desulfitibacter sp. BRH_c19]